MPLLLFSDPQMVYPVDVNQFQGQAVHRLNQQHIQLGLRKGMAVLVYYRVQRGPHVNEVFQAVLIAHESTVTRGKKTENKLWKRVVPSETEFAWLPPDIAWAFCSDALRRRRDCQYLAFHEAHMGLQGRAFQANIYIVDMVFLGDTRSAEELAVFTNMAPERLCLGCGLRVEEKFTPIFPGERGPLFTASVKLLQFALRASSASASGKGLTEEEEALRRAIRPLVTNPDCHFLAVLTVLVQLHYEQVALTYEVCWANPLWTQWNLELGSEQEQILRLLRRAILDLPSSMPGASQRLDIEVKFAWPVIRSRFRMWLRSSFWHCSHGLAVLMEVTSKGMGAVNLNPLWLLLLQCLGGLVVLVLFLFCKIVVSKFLGGDSPEQWSPSLFFHDSNVSKS